MKLITAIIRPDKADELVQVLIASRVPGLTVTEVRGFGRQYGRLAAGQAAAATGLLPKVRLEQDRRLLGELGGTLRQIRADDPASGLIRAAHKAGACQLVIGSRRRSRWSRLLNGSTVADQVLRAADDLPVQVVNVGHSDKTSDE